MWSFLIILFFSTSWVEGQNGRGRRQHDHSGNGWDIKLAVPGEPGSDYPTLGTIPRTSFSCAGKEPGYYADLETNCQVFRICTIGSTYGFQSFLCPNGTLFNQAVFVCDWWMNVNCKKSEELFNNNNDRFGNLKLGPQLMKDVKKMITHPMRNPYDKTAMKSNLVVMQNYKPPFGQMYPNAALLANAERIPKNVYIPAQQIQAPPQNGYNNVVFSASTPEPRYLPPSFNNIQNTNQGNTEIFQRQKQYQTQNNQLQTPQIGNYVNGHSGRNSQNSYATFSNNDNYSQITRTISSNGQKNLQYNQNQINNVNPTFNTPNNAINQKSQLTQQNTQFINNNKFSQFNNKQQQFGSNRDNEAYIYNTPLPKFSNEIADHTEAKQNLVSTKSDTIPPTIITRTLTFSRYVEEPKPGKPKSRVTVKTWIVKPKSKSARIVQSSSTPYTYDRPTRAPAERLTDATTPYVYNKPSTTFSQSQVISETDEPYYYSRPTIAAKQVVTNATEQQSSSRPTIASRIVLEPTIPTPSKASRLYLAPTTFKPAVKLYLPPTENELSSPILARQYLSPNAIQQSTNRPSEQLQVSSSTLSSSTYTVPTTVATTDPSYSISKESRVNTNHNNLTFADILTREKLDITVNNIVKDTSSYLNTATPAQYGQYKQDATQLDYPTDNYLPPLESFESGENLTAETPTVASTSSRLIASPSLDLEPPEESYDVKQNTNQLSSLPFLKEPVYPTNTIERTVSLKISIPEKLASYLFKRRNQSDYERLEILNTGSSNYLVLSNNPVTKSSGSNFIPIGKLIEDKNSSFSNSQALVFSLLADSINVAKEYNNYVREDSVISTPTPPQFQNVNNEQLAQITNTISQLTSSQYAGNGYNNNGKIASAAQIASNTGYQYNSPPARIVQKQETPNLQPFTTPVSQVSNQNQFSAQFQNSLNTNFQPLTQNQNQIFSGQLYQLPVPDVTDQIYNRQSINQNTANLIQSNNVQRQNTISNKNNNVNNNLLRSTNTEVETVRSIAVPPPPARLQLATTNEPYNIHNNINNYLTADNTISAQIQDKIIGTIPHPLEDNKLVSYEKDQTYIVYTKPNNVNRQNIQQNANLIQGSSVPNQVMFQFIPSIGYQLENEKEQQKILNAFQIDEFGSPRIKSGQLQNSNSNQDILTSSINYTVDHTPSNNQNKNQFNNINSLYAGPSSYSAPQSSIGNLGQGTNSRLELEENNGYSRVTPARPFSV